MKIFSSVLLGLCLSLASISWGAEPVVVLGGNAGAGQHLTAPSSTVDIPQNSGSRCQAPSVGSCGSCSVSCPVGQAATCKPGRAVGHDVDASCVTEPSCSCK